MRRNSLRATRWGVDDGPSYSNSSVKCPISMRAMLAVEPAANDFELSPSSARRLPTTPPVARADNAPHARFCDGDVQTARDLLAELAAMATDEEPDDALDVIYGTFDDLLDADRIDACRAVLAQLDVAALPNVQALAFVSISSPARERLGRERADFVSRVRRHLTRVEPARVEALLAGIE